jgi:hypothetical protein
MSVCELQTRDLYWKVTGISKGTDLLLGLIKRHFMDTNGGETSIVPRILNLVKMEMSGQINAQAVLLPGESLW